MRKAAKLAALFSAGVVILALSSAQSLALPHPSPPSSTPASPVACRPETGGHRATARAAKRQRPGRSDTCTPAIGPESPPTLLSPPSRWHTPGASLKCVTQTVKCVSEPFLMTSVSSWNPVRAQPGSAVALLRADCHADMFRGAWRRTQTCTTPRHKPVCYVWPVAPAETSPDQAQRQRRTLGVTHCGSKRTNQERSFSLRYVFFPHHAAARRIHTPLPRPPPIANTVGSSRGRTETPATREPPDTLARSPPVPNRSRGRFGAN